MMIRKVSIQNFKSIADLDISLGRLNVFIGENGAGKSNFLEALAFGAAASTRQLSHEFLASRGIRSVDPSLMRSAFGGTGEEIKIEVGGAGDLTGTLELQWTDLGWQGQGQEISDETALAVLDQLLGKSGAHDEVLERLRRHIELAVRSEFLTEIGLSTFLAFSPEYSALRIFLDETQILPLGIRGEGLFSHLQALSRAADLSTFQKIGDELDILGWFDGFVLPSDLGPGERRLRIRDRYLTEQTVFDQRSANEGFLFLLFYFTLVISPHTPPVFAVDNVDASLNPKLCTALIRRLAVLSGEHRKQLLLTTHNPAVLDGLDLHDDEQRLFVVSRSRDGHTRIRRVEPPRPLDGEPPVPLSEAFLKGYLGGLPQNF